MSSEPISLPPSLPRSGMTRSAKLILAATLAVALVLGLLVALRFTGHLRPFHVPSVAMSPTIEPGDHLMMEGVTFVFGDPKRGDVIVFRTDNIPKFRAPAMIISRVAGLPGERLQFIDGKLHANGQPVSLQNIKGEISYVSLPRMEFMRDAEIVVVPEDCYFVLGDNSANSFDSRFWGCVSREDILGRAVVRYWPPDRVGGIK